MPNFIAFSYAILSLYHWEVCSFLKGNEKAVHTGHRIGGEGPCGGQRKEDSARNI